MVNRLCRSGKSNMKEISMTDRSGIQAGRPLKAIALIAAVWLITLSGVALYAEQAPTPPSAEAAVYTTHLTST
jgi:hypothetical protein